MDKRTSILRTCRAERNDLRCRQGMIQVQDMETRLCRQVCGTHVGCASKALNKPTLAKRQRVHGEIA